jgi:hypothetical protein
MSGGTQNYENYGNINPRLRDASGTAFFYLTEWLCFRMVEAIPGHPWTTKAAFSQNFNTLKSLNYGKGK